MTVDLTTSSDFVAVLAQAAAAYRGQNRDRPSAGMLVEALLQAEKAAKQQRLTYSFAALLGQWQLCFVTGTRKVRERGGIILGKGFYWPKFTPTYISFATTQALEETPIKGEVANQVQFGSVLTKLTGPGQYLGKKNLLAFNFTHIQISLFNRVVYDKPFSKAKAQTDNFYNQPIAKLPFFAFFLITEEFIAARGRGGGLALWVRF
ncbi:MAG: hypothetical protein KME21_23735 [Desmonostoc vinosum HA7617-LM4]|jgi:hypothetical protein|nr:hypothetical protein [Desmonostoc vinosum HA7617-LM4]